MSTSRSYEAKTLGAFLSEIASEKVIPAGGTSAAVTGAMGASLCEMTCLHTVGKEGYSDVEPELVATSDELATLRNHLFQLANSDATVVEDLLEADDNERQLRMKRSTGVPLTIAEASLSVLDSATVVTAKGSENALADAGCGALFADAALQAAMFIVQTNLEHIDDPSFNKKMERRVSEIEVVAENTFDQIRSNLELSTRS